MELRPLPDDEAGDRLFARYVQYAFAPDRGPDVDLDEDRPAPPRDRYGLYPPDGDGPVSICSSYDFRTRLRGTTLPMGGVSTVATPPEHRRQGHVATMLRALCREYRDDGTPLAALWPFDHPFYAQFGWATASRYLEWSGAPSALREAAADDGSWEQVDADAWADLDTVHERATDGYQLALDRSEAWWRERQLRGWESDPYVYLWRDDAGDPRAYVAYRIEGDWGDRTFVVRSNYEATDRAALRNVLGFVADHDSQVGEFNLRTAVDVSLHDMVDDPEALECELHAGPMVRVVDVPAALSALSYPVDARLTVGLEDPLLPAVAGRYEVAAADGTARVERVDESAASADATLGVGAFSQLVVGYRSAADLERAGELDADAATVETLDSLFPERTPYLQEGF